MGLIDRYRAGRAERLQRKLEKVRAKLPAPPPSAASAEAVALASQALGHRFSQSITWDDLDQRYVFLGPQTPVYPSMGFTDDDLDRLLRASAWSWASINGNAKAMSRLTPQVEEKTDGSWRKHEGGHPLDSFLADPLGTDDRLPWWSWQQLFYVMALHYYSAGNGWLIPVDSATGLSVVPLLQPHLVEAYDARGMVAGPYTPPREFRYQRPGLPTQAWPAGSVVNIMAPGPSSFWKGSSPLRAALRSTEIDHIATERQRYNLRNRISPGVAVTFDHPLGVNPVQREVVKQELIDDYQAAQDDGMPWIAGSGAKFEKGFTPDELQVFDTKKSAREEIIATIGTQPSILGQLDSATYSNTKEATVLWFTGSIEPVLALMYGQINAQLIQRKYGPDIRIAPTLVGSQIGIQLLSSKLDVGEKLQKLGYTTNDIDAHLELGMGEKDYLNKTTSAAVIAGREDPAEDSDAPEQDEPTEGDEPELAIVAGADA